ncbi:MAG: AP2 domain-containing protein [Microbacteriaceae bacterium]|nr:AP2 domain-containing protein [Microbacteriaceae bacterium]
MITREEVMQILDYDGATGAFTWKISSRNQVKVGDEAGTVWVDNKGKSYRRIMINRKAYKAHRVAWLILTGEFPADQIDHTDGNGLNNAANNLRSVSNAENCKNKRKYKSNASGVVGVSWNKRDCKYEAYIKINGRQIHLGYFESFEEAVAARKSAEIKYGFHENHGSTRPL